MVRWQKSLLMGLGMLLGVLLACDAVTGLLGLLPAWPDPSAITRVAGSVCGEWQVQPSPSVGFLRDFGAAMAEADRTLGWDDLAPGFQPGHRTGAELAQGPGRGSVRRCLGGRLYNAAYFAHQTNSATFSSSLGWHPLDRDPQPRYRRRLGGTE